MSRLDKFINFSTEICKVKDTVKRSPMVVLLEELEAGLVEELQLVKVAGVRQLAAGQVKLSAHSVPELSP